MLKSLRHEMENAGHHIFSINRQKIHNYYPGTSNNYPGASFNTLSVNDLITIKVFYIDDSGRLDDLYVDLLVREIGGNQVQAMILTSLPDNFPLKKGSVIEVQEDEILYNIMYKDVTRRDPVSTKIH